MTRVVIRNIMWATLLLDSVAVFSQTSTLPIFLINTNGAEILDEPKIEAYLEIVYNGEGVLNHIDDEPSEYEGRIGIELRGNSTLLFPKKQYSFETHDEEGDDIDVALFGWPEEEDWILRASYLDHTFIRNPLAMHMSRSMGHWASRCQHVEVYLNGDYQGIHILMEKIKRDKGRLDINKLKEDETSGEDLTGGYLFEVNGSEEDFGRARSLKEPDFEDAAPEQINYIRDYDDGFREAVFDVNWADSIEGYRRWIDPASFIDELLVQEAVRNGDAYENSSYFYKDKNEKLKAGPVWDFDQSAGNSSHPDNGHVEGWLFMNPGKPVVPLFWRALMEDPDFGYATRLRWQSLRAGAFSTENLQLFIDSIASYLEPAVGREFERWPVLGVDIWRETMGFEDRDTYQKEVEYLKEFLAQRWEWMDQELAQVGDPNLANKLRIWPTVQSLSVVPLPTARRDFFHENGIVEGMSNVQILDISGRVLMDLSQDASKIAQEGISIAELATGTYLIQAIVDGAWIGTGKFTRE